MRDAAGLREEIRSLREQHQVISTVKVGLEAVLVQKEVVIKDLRTSIRKYEKVVANLKEKVSVLRSAKLQVQQLKQHIVDWEISVAELEANNVKLEEAVHHKNEENLGLEQNLAQHSQKLDGMVSKYTNLLAKY